MCLGQTGGGEDAPKLEKEESWEGTWGFSRHNYCGSTHAIVNAAGTAPNLQQRPLGSTMAYS